MKKILIINTTFDKGGAAGVARDLFYGLQNKNDLQMFFAYGRGKKIKETRTFYFGNFFETLVHVFLVRFLGLEGYGNYFSTLKLINFIKKEKFDLVNLHNLHGYYLNFFTLVKFLQKEKIPTIWTMHDEWSITSLSAHSMGCVHCKTGIGKCTNNYFYPKTYFPLFSQYMLRNKNRIFSRDWSLSIICPSIWLGEKIKNSYLNKFIISTIHNGIDTEVFKPITNKKEIRIKYNLPLDKKIVLFSAASLKDKNKGIQHIFKVADILKNENIVFLGIGQFSKKIFPNIIFLNYIKEKNKIAEIYAAVDLYCFASNAETFLLSAAEALSCKIPIVGFGIEVVKEIFSKDVGIFVEPKNEKQLADSIIYLLENEEKNLEFGLEGRELIKNKYSINLFWLNYENLFNNFLK